MKNCLTIKYLLPVLLVLVGISFVSTHSAFAVPVSYNQTSLVIPWQTVPRNSSSFDVFMDLPSTLLWYKFNNNTLDSSPSLNNGTITYNTNLKKYFSFNSVLTDTIGHGNLVITGATQYISGQEGNAFNFNGTSYGKASGTALVNGTGDRSVTFWVKTPSTFTTNSFLFSYGGLSNNNLFGAEWSTTASTSKLLFVGIANDHLTNTIFTGNHWEHIAITLGSTGTILTIYVNGTQDSQFTVTTLNTSASGFYIGSRTDATDFLQSGTYIDEFRYYNSDLSAAQVSALYMVGKYQQSHTFDGGEYVTAGTVNAFNWERTVPFTTSFWAKDSSLSGTETITGNGLSPGWLVNLESGGVFSFILSNSFGSNTLYVYSSGAFSDNAWHYYVLTYDGSSSPSGVKFYIDGILKTTQISQNTLSASTISSNPLTVGERSGAGNSFFTGQLDDLVISNTAWTQAQVTQYHNSEFSLSYNPNIVTSWYHGVSGSSTVTKKLGFGPSSLTLNCNWSSTTGKPVSNGTNIYYSCASGNSHIYYKLNVAITTSSEVFRDIGANGPPAGNFLFVNNKQFYGMTYGSYDVGITNSHGNDTLCASAGAGCTPSTVLISNQKMGTVGYTAFLRWNFNYTGTPTTQNLAGTNTCEFLSSANVTIPASSIACDQSFQANTTRYTEGMLITKNAVYGTNSSLPFFTAINADPNGNLLTIPSIILGVSSDPNTRLILSSNNQNYYIMVSSTAVNFVSLQTLQSQLINEGRAFQSYLLVPYGNTDSKLGFPSTGMATSTMMLYGTGLNTTVTKYGEFTLPSGYTAKTSSIQSAVRTLDPQWSNLGMSPYTALSTGGSSNFPIILTVSNAPTDGALQLVYSTVTWTNQNSIWCLTQLDSTHTAECDIAPDQCPLIYVADISKLPIVWNYEGNVCANGVSQKTVSYTQTLPLTFYTMNLAATSSYTPGTNGLSTTVRTSLTGPTTYTVIIKNSTGTIAQNSTFTFNGTLDTRNFNVSSVTKPASLYISTPNQGTIYTAYMGSSLSLASVSSFFHQYLSYQGFDLLSFIPVIFASMFTRNTIGIGMALTVVCIATLSWISVVVVPDAVVYISMIIAVLGMIGYRSLYQ